MLALDSLLYFYGRFARLSLSFVNQRYQLLLLLMMAAYTPAMSDCGFWKRRTPSAFSFYSKKKHSLRYSSPVITQAYANAAKAALTRQIGASERTPTTSI